MAHLTAAEGLGAVGDVGAVGAEADAAAGGVAGEGAYAFVLAYLKIRKCKNIEGLIINRYADMPLDDESGLHLGLRYENGYADPRHIFVIPGDYKKICYAIRDMETANEKNWVSEAREYIGSELFDKLLSPSLPKETDYFKNTANSI